MGRRILVVDDDPRIVRLVGINLEMEGYEVASASNGREALEQVAAFAPDLVVCDVMMPVMNGLEVVARMRRDPQTARLPVIMLSAKAQEIDIRQGKGVGATAYITKPFDPVELIDAVARLLEDSIPTAAPQEQRRTRARPSRSKKT